MSSEEWRIEHLAAWLGSESPAPGVLLSIGDDAAVLDPGPHSLVWTVDSSVEGVHFRRDWLSLDDIGYRSLMAAASDLAAMGASPRGILSSLILPSEMTDAELERLVRGQGQAAQRIGTRVIGGNLARGGELSVTTTVLGAASHFPLRRAGARSNDVIAVAGPVGLARAGLIALQRARADEPGLAPAVAAWRQPQARIEDGLRAAGIAHAAIDLSDGLEIDALRLARASGVRIVLEARSLLEAGGMALAEAGRALSLSPLDLLLVGGEDYALLAAFEANQVPKGFVAIGTCREGQGLALQDHGGSVRELLGQGYDHFANRPS